MGEKCIMRSFEVCTLHQMLLELQNQGGSNEKACSLIGNNMKCTQDFRWKIQIEETSWETTDNIKNGC